MLRNGKLFCRLVLVFALLAPAVGAGAAPPPDVAYQGRLLDATGAPLTGFVDLELRIFDQPADGTLLYAERHEGVALRDGIFQILLGTGSLPQGSFDADLFAASNRYLEVAVDGETLSPRQPLSSTPYAFQSQFAVQAGNADQVGTVPASEVITNANLATRFETEVTQVLDSQIPATLVRDSELAGTVAALESEIDALEAENAALAARLDALESLLAGVTRDGDTLRFSAMNVQVVNGMGSSSTTNGLGNLIVGYGEPRSAAAGPTDRSGSHNLVVGSEHNYSSFGTLLAGKRNDTTAGFTAVTGGFGNLAGADFASVSGGQSNRALSTGASVAGGLSNTASGPQASVSGGEDNTASGSRAHVSGGTANLALGTQASVTGGSANRAEGTATSVTGGANNRATGNASSISGGRDNVTENDQTSVSGGRLNKASGTAASVSGGSNNRASGDSTSVSGGRFNIASGDGTSVLGGIENAASGLEAASVSGGFGNSSNGAASHVTGGRQNRATGGQANVNGGRENVAAGDFSAVGGGLTRTTEGQHDWKAGSLFEEF